MEGNKKIKVLVLSTSPKRKGGVTNYVKLLMQYLDKKKYHVNHFTQGKNPTKWKNIFLPFIVTYQLLKFKHVLKEYQPDIVHLNSGIGKTSIIRDFVFLKMAKRERSFSLFFIHGWKKPVFDFINSNRLFKKIFYNRISMADIVVVSASEFKEELVDLGIDSQKIFVSSTMVESEKYCPEDKDFDSPLKVLFCAGMHIKKGPYELLNAVPFALEKYPQTKFIFVGEGKELENLKEKSMELSIENNVEFTGYISNIEKIKIFKNAYIFVFPSYTEGFPNVILEAMAAGMPLVTTPVGGLADALEDGKQGFIIKSMPPEPKEVAEKIIKLIENPKLMKKMSENNLKEAKEKYDVKVVSEEIGEIYEEIMGS